MTTAIIIFVCFRVLELEESLGSTHLLQQNIKQKDEKVSSLNQVIQEREEKLAELENRLDFLICFECYEWKLATSELQGQMELSQL